MSEQDARSLPFAPWLSSDPAVQGPRESVSRLYESSSVLVFRTVHALVRNPEEAEDITQEAFLRLFVAMSQNGASIPNTVAWVVRVAKNLARDRIKTAKHHTPITDILAAVIVDRSKTAEQLLVEASRLQIWLQLQSRLPVAERDCVELFLRGANFRQISATLGLQYDDAIARTKRGVARFRRLATEGR